MAVALFTGIFALMGWGSLLGTVGSTILYPFRWVADTWTESISGYFDYFADMDELRAEVDFLKAENESLKSALIDAEIAMDESQWLYRYLSMKEEHTDYALCAAAVVSSTSVSGAGGDFATELTLNKGTASGVEKGMPVVTEVGLVGVVVEVGRNHCRVSTILDPSVSVGAVTTRSSENGLCEGDYAHVHAGHAVLRYLPEEADISEEDLVITGGQGSVYPYGIPIGRVIQVSSNAFSRTTEAVLEPFADFSDLTQVVILTSFVRYADGYEPNDGGAE